jgi:hypothetical protein
LQDPISKKILHNKKGLDPEFKPQYLKKKERKKLG